ncbi:NarK family nitrate/nitrite MFS transporter [uncultured Tolumonas sp.]|uniref:NarK family nitrate/nitrite MFS transporter n=1 Tax=uncultured Tolumonas sp. TaxID=263765 RepID=UPI0029305ADD|nr:NarK family nitrate/nitrite MFS transporter [uncultured Tolumonas sp.]
MKQDNKFNMLSFTGKMKILHLSWIAFFITFVVWFNHAPLLGSIAKSLDISMAQVKTLLILNVALTIPARIIIGMLTDKFGPRLTYSFLLFAGSLPCFWFAFATDFTQLAMARLLLGFVGAGFVIGIRMVSEWFPANELGIAEGIYGGWGNFGSAAAAIAMPTLALFFGGENGWRYAVAMSGLICLAFSVIWYFNVSDSPKGSTYFKSKKMGGLEVTSKGDFFFLLLMKLPMYIALGLVGWKLSPHGVALISNTMTTVLYVIFAAILIYDCVSSYRVNKDIFHTPVPEIQRYQFKQVAAVNILYFTTFGSELAVVSMLPLFFADLFKLDMVHAGLVGSLFAFMNLVARPSGGWLSDRFGRKKTLMFVIAGLAMGYCAMSMITNAWPLFLAVLVVIACSFCVQAGCGAVFAVVPLIKRRLTGQIAGMTGAYGNTGGVFFLTVLSLVDYSTFFIVIAATAILGIIAILFMNEPRGHMVEINEDGSVELIKVG